MCVCVCGDTDMCTTERDMLTFDWFRCATEIFSTNEAYLRALILHKIPFAVFPLNNVNFISAENER